MGIETAIFGAATLATTALSAGAARSASDQQNEAIERSQASLTRSTVATQQQLVDSAQLERLKVARNAAQIEGRIRAARGTAGQGMDGSTLALIRQNDITAAENTAIIGQNLRNQIELAQSGFEANAAQLSAGYTNPTLASVTGGLSGFNSGLSLISGLGQVSKYLQTSRNTDFEPVNIL